MEFKNYTLEETRTALEDSILHWEENAACTNAEEGCIGSTNCALCTLFIYQGCNGCPVRNHTGKVLCEETPYFDAAQALLMEEMGLFRDASQDMVDLLTLLRREI
jgi:hypothetical protein